MKYVVIAIIALAVWFVAARILDRRGAAWDLAFVKAKIKALGNRVHYTVGVVALIIVVYCILRSLVTVILVYY